jgi:hypothetical protein
VWGSEGEGNKAYQDAIRMRCGTEALAGLSEVRTSVSIQQRGTLRM